MGYWLFAIIREVSTCSRRKQGGPYRGRVSPQSMQNLARQQLLLCIRQRGASEYVYLIYERSEKLNVNLRCECTSGIERKNA